MVLREHLICIALIGGGLLLPDWYLGYYTKILTCTIPLATFLSVLGLAVLLSMVKSRGFLAAVVVMITIAQAIQLNHWVYFGAPIHSQDITKAFVELDEIFQTGVSLANTLWPVWLAQALATILIVWGILRAKRCRHLPLVWVAVVLVLAINPVLSYLKGPEFFYTKPTSSTLYNTSKAFSDWFVNSQTSAHQLHYQPYQITYTQPKVKNIVLIMGESLSSRYMQLYGYAEQANTPYLASLKRDPNFAYAKGVSSSVSTITCLQLFFNNLHNPGFNSLIRSKAANLFRLARHQGYKTFVLSAQNEKLFHETGTEFVDYFSFEKDLRKLLNVKGDEALLDALATLKFDAKNFIVIHLRHIHSPFGEYAKYHPELATSNLATSNLATRHPDDARVSQTQHEYAQAIAYHDAWVKHCVHCLQRILPNDTMIIFTSDHGELVGEDGLFGHNLMRPEVADVPVWAYAIHADLSLNNYLKAQPICSHYDLGKQIARLFGAEIVNPNEAPTLQFVHGTELQTNYQLMPWKKAGDRVEFLKVQRVNDVVN